jgi:HAD superfamily hydrolase (TIGR01484 family)
MKLLAFDLDDTLAPSKSSIPKDISDQLSILLDKYQVCIISGGSYSQFQDQVLGFLPDNANLDNLHLMPTCGTQYYRHVDGEWAEIYSDNLDKMEIKNIFEVIEEESKYLGLWEKTTFGPAIEDRKSQVTYSALGQNAPLDLKRHWDRSGKKKEMLAGVLSLALPHLSVRSGGSTSIDITKRGVDKAYGMTVLSKYTNIDYDDMLFIGDRLDEGGNDYPVKAMGIKTIQVENHKQTAELIKSINNLPL